MSEHDFDFLKGLRELSDEERHQRTLAGIADVDAGRTTSHEEVMLCMRSLLRSRQTSNSAD